MVEESRVASIKDTLQPVFRKYGDVVCFAYLFGSMAVEAAGPLSDVDVAVFVQNPDSFDINEKLMLHGDCCRALRRNDVDLVVLNRMRNLILADRIVRTGVVIWNSDNELKDSYELHIMHQAIDFRLQRKREMGS